MLTTFSFAVEFSLERSVEVGLLMATGKNTSCLCLSLVLFLVDVFGLCICNLFGCWSCSPFDCIYVSAFDEMMIVFETDVTSGSVYSRKRYRPSVSLQSDGGMVVL